MREDIPANMDEIWRAGNFTGPLRPSRRVTIQRPKMRRDVFQLRSTFRRVSFDPGAIPSFNPYPSGLDPTTGEPITQIYNDYLFTSPEPPLEFGGVRSISWTRTTDVDTAECTVEFSNSMPLPEGEISMTGDLDQPGYYTPGRGTTPFSAARWNQTPNEFSRLMQPDNILRTYEGYGVDWTVPPERDPHMVLTGVWIIDDITPSARGGLTVSARDPGRLLIDHIAFVPVVPEDFYPLSFQSWEDPVAVSRQFSDVTIERLPIRPGGSGNDLWPEHDYPGAQIYGHALVHAFDDDPSSYWLSVGNESPGYRSAYEYIDIDLDDAHVTEVRFWTVGRGYNAYVSVMQTNGQWMPGPTMPYRRDGRGRYDEGIPYIASVGGLASEGEHIIRLTNVWSVVKVRLWLGNLQDFNLGSGYQYRAGIRSVACWGAVHRSGINTNQVQLTRGPTGSNPSRVNDLTDIVKIMCAWAGLYWPSDGYQIESDGNQVPAGPRRRDTWVLGRGVNGRVWGDFQQTGIAPVNEITVATFDKKTLMEGISYVRDMVGFIFYFDETGAVQWRQPNIWGMGNWISGMSPQPGRTQRMLTIDERQTLTDLEATITSRHVREGIFVSNPVGKFAALVPGYNPNPTGLLRHFGWSDQNFANKREALVMADLAAVRMLFKYRTDRVTIPAHPGIQIDDQVRIFERVTSEGFVHYVNGITSNNNAADGRWTYTLQTHWLGDNPDGRWVTDIASLSMAAQGFVKSLGMIEFSRRGDIGDAVDTGEGEEFPVAPSGPGVPSAPTATPTPTPVEPAPAPEPTPEPSPGVSARAAEDWPFASSSIWNTPMGDGATFAPGSDARVVNLRSGTATVNWSVYTLARIKTRTTDPLRTIKVINNDGVLVETLSLRVPTDIRFSGEVYMTGLNPDSWLSLISPDGNTVHDFYKAIPQADGSITARRHQEYSTLTDGISGSGMRASRIPLLGGAITVPELHSTATPRLRIPHALAMAGPDGMLLNPNADSAYLTPGYQWPARGFDANGRTAYSGKVRMGTMLALPRSLNIEGLALTAEGKALAYALRDFGGYIVDRSSFVSVYVAVGGNQNAATRMKTDMQRVLYPLLTIVTNASKTAVGGPGSRVRSLAPEL